MLKDRDRVVRESACLSLAHMRCQRAVPNIVYVWYNIYSLELYHALPVRLVHFRFYRRNDAIKHVREAATLALKLIGGEDAAEAVKVTELLTQEVSKLKTSDD